MPSSGIHGHGTTLSGSIAGTISHIRQLGFDGLEIDPLDISTMLSEGKWREKISGMKDSGELSLELVYEKSNMQKLLAAFGVKQVWTITVPDGSTLVVEAYLRTVSLPVNFEEAIMQSAALVCSGPPVFTPGS